MDSDHACPKMGCPAKLDFFTLACKKHWFELPPELRGRINRLWRRGMTFEYMQARTEAWEVLNGVKQ